MQLGCDPKEGKVHLRATGMKKTTRFANPRSRCGLVGLVPGVTWGVLVPGETWGLPQIDPPLPRKILELTSPHKRL